MEKRDTSNGKTHLLVAASDHTELTFISIWLPASTARANAADHAIAAHLSIGLPFPSPASASNPSLIDRVSNLDTRRQRIPTSSEGTGRASFLLIARYQVATRLESTASRVFTGYEPSGGCAQTKRIGNTQAEVSFCAPVRLFAS
jgi:hypothetical protein